VLDGSKSRVDLGTAALPVGGRGCRASSAAVWCSGARATLSIFACHHTAINFSVLGDLRTPAARVGRGAYSDINGGGGGIAGSGGSGHTTFVGSRSGLIFLTCLRAALGAITGMASRPKPIPQTKLSAPMIHSMVNLL
jgi:hypothetical protein